MEIQIAVQKLENQRRTLQMLGAIYILVYVLAFAAAIFNLWLGLVLVLCNIGFLMACLRPKTKRYQHDFNDNALHFSFCTGMTDYRYSEKKEVSDNALYELPLLPSDSVEVLCKEGFTARSRDFTVAGNEIALHYKVSQTEKGKLNYNFWSGTLLEFAWQATAVPMPLCTLLDRHLAESDAVTSLKCKGVVEKELTDPFLAEKFILLQPEDAQPICNAVSKCVKRLAQAAQEGLALCLQDQRLVVFMNGRFYAQKIMVKHPVSEAMLQGSCFTGQDELLKLVRCCANAKNNRAPVDL